MKESSKPIRRVAEELGVSENNLYNLRKQLGEKANRAFSNQLRLDENELEIRRLKARVIGAGRRAGNIKKSRDFRKRGKPAIYAIIKQQSVFHSVRRLCQAFDLSTSSYYRWLKCPVGKRQREDQKLFEDIKRIFKKSRSTYGSPRMQRTLCEEGNGSTQVSITKHPRPLRELLKVGVHFFEERSRWACSDSGCYGKRFFTMLSKEVV